MLYRIIKSRKGEGYLDVILVVLSAMLVIALIIKVFPVFIAKHRMDTFASELCRTAEISGQVGHHTSAREAELVEQTGVKPTISWTADYVYGTKKIQLNENITVELRYTVDIGLFGSFGSFPIELSARATGRSEVYWK